MRRSHDFNGKPVSIVGPMKKKCIKKPFPNGESYEQAIKRVQDFYIKGKIEPLVFNKSQIMRFILQSQHILPKSRFNNPLEAIRVLGGIRSNYEMRLRLDGKFYDIKEFRKNLNLIAGPMIPEFYIYCTEKDLQIYKAAKSRDLDFNMEYILESMPDDFAISGKEKLIYIGLYIFINSWNNGFISFLIS